MKSRLKWTNQSSYWLFRLIKWRVPHGTDWKSRISNCTFNHMCIQPMNVGGKSQYQWYTYDNITFSHLQSMVVDVQSAQSLLFLTMDFCKNSALCYGTNDRDAGITYQFAHDTLSPWWSSGRFDISLNVHISWPSLSKFNAPAMINGENGMDGEWASRVCVHTCCH